MPFLLSLLCLQTTAQKLFTKLTELTDANWSSRLQEGEEIWVVAFYVPWDPHARDFAPKMEAVAEELTAHGYWMDFGAVDVSTARNLGYQYGIESSPTIKILYLENGRWLSQDFQEGGTDSVRTFCQNFYRSRNIPYSDLPADFEDGDIVYLDDSNFDHMMESSNEIWMLMFAAPWCYHCNMAKPIYTGAAAEVGADVRFAIIDADANRGLAKRFAISSLPTFKFYHAGYGKNDGNVQDYTAGRKQADFVTFARSLYQEYQSNPSKFAWTTASRVAPLLKVNESAGVSKLPEHVREICSDNSLCVVAFLPDTIYRSNQAQDMSTVLT